MFRMGSVLDRDNDYGVSSAKPERTIRYRDLLNARIGVGYRRSHRTRLRACAYPTRINRRSRGANTPHGIPDGRQVIP